MVGSLRLAHPTLASTFAPRRAHRPPFFVSHSADLLLFIARRIVCADEIGFDLKPALFAAFGKQEDQICSLSIEAGCAVVIERPIRRIARLADVDDDVFARGNLRQRVNGANRIKLLRPRVDVEGVLLTGLAGKRDGPSCRRNICSHVDLHASDVARAVPCHKLAQMDITSTDSEHHRTES